MKLTKKREWMNVRMHLNIGVGVDIDCVEKKRTIRNLRKDFFSSQFNLRQFILVELNRKWWKMERANCDMNETRTRQLTTIIFNDNVMYAHQWIQNDGNHRKWQYCTLKYDNAEEEEKKNIWNDIAIVQIKQKIKKNVWNFIHWLSIT